MKNYGLGRLLDIDARDTLFPMQSVLPEAPPPRTYRYWWSDGWWGDQGLTPHCVAYAWLHFLEDGPLTHAPKAKNSGVLFDPKWVYCEAQKVDEWDGDCVNYRYDGTSVRAGAKVMQKTGLVGAYYWAWDIDTVIEALLYKGPVVVGTFWYEQMFEPDEKYFIRPKGPVAGGHAYVLNGVSVNREVFRVKNSWGRTWGLNGFAYISFKDFELLLGQQGEACIATELSPDEDI